MVDALLADLSVSLQVLDENILMQVLAEVVATQGRERQAARPVSNNYFGRSTG